MNIQIYVDADACPVKSEILKEAKSANIPVTLVKSYAHFANKEEPEGVKTIYVDSGTDAADFRIMQLIHKQDILVTQDYGLASLALEKGATVLHHTGYQYNQKNIEELLALRHASAKARKSGKKTKGPKSLTSQDRSRFRQLLHDTIRTDNKF